MKRIIIFASGNGTNAENIIQYFQANEKAEITHVFSNKIDAEVLNKAAKYKVKALHFDRVSLYESNEVLHIVKDIEPDLIVLAGFLWKFPENIITEYPNQIVNIHPALLPKYGGKGMYGMNVHRAIVANKEPFSGITIHFVNENYDEGRIIFQVKTPIEPSDKPEDVAKKVHELEYEYFPEVIEGILSGSIK